MKRYLSSLILIVASAVLNPADTHAQDQPAKNKVKLAPVRQTKELDRKLSEAEQLIKLLIKQTESENEYIRGSAYATLANSPKVTISLHGQLIPIVTRGLQSAQRSVVTNALAILDRADLSDEQRLQVLVDGAATRNQLVLQRLEKDREEVLELIIDQMKNEPAKEHPSAYAIIEHLGENAASAVDALFVNYQQRHAARTERVKRYRLDYLDMVYAIGNVGPQAASAKQIAIDAANRYNISGPSEEYEMAGMVCLEKMTLPMTDRKNAPVSGGLMGGVSDARLASAMLYRTRNRGLRATVDAYSRVRSRAQAVARNTNSGTERNAKLVFQNYDIHMPAGQLTIEELRSMKATFLIEEVDQNEDKMISEAEYIQFLKQAASGQFSKSTVSQSSRSR